MITEARHLTREESAGYCTALTDLHAWHQGQIETAEKQIAALTEGLRATKPVHMLAVSMLEEQVEVHQNAIAEIARIKAQQIARTFPK